MSSVPTEEYIPRFKRQATPYRLNDVREIDWDQYPDWVHPLFFPREYDPSVPPKPTQSTITMSLRGRPTEDIELVLDLALVHHAEDELFFMFYHLGSREPFPGSVVATWIERYPPLVFVLLKMFPPHPDTNTLQGVLEELAFPIIRALIRSANELKIAVLAGLEKLAGSIRYLGLSDYFDLLTLAALSVRSQQLVQEVLLVLNDSRVEGETNHALKYGYKHTLAVAFDTAEEAADECPCNEDGRPRRQKMAPTQTRLTRTTDESSTVKATIRVDAKTSARLHSHVRLEASSKPENRWISIPVLDGLVIQASKGELKIQLLHPPPPEMEDMDWNLYTAGSIGNVFHLLGMATCPNMFIATSRAMTDAMLRFLTEKEGCCAFYSLIVNQTGPGSIIDEIGASTIEFQLDDHLNESQKAAVTLPTRGPLSLIWGPPGDYKVGILPPISHKEYQVPERQQS